MQRRYITVDVFTDRAFGGNPLAVVLDAGGLSTAQMQAIASEFNYSETTFVLPPQDPVHDAQVRIFTVRSEIPFAGHPNVGTAFVLAAQAATPPARLLFEEQAGLVAVEVLTEQGRAVGAELTAPQPLKKLTQSGADQAAAVFRCLGTSFPSSSAPDRLGRAAVSGGGGSLRDALRGPSRILGIRQRFRNGCDAVTYTRDVPPSEASTCRRGCSTRVQAAFPRILPRATLLQPRRCWPILALARWRIKLRSARAPTYGRACR